MSESFSYFPDIKGPPDGIHEDVVRLADGVRGGNFKSGVTGFRSRIFDKRNLPAWTISGVFEGGHRKDQLVSPSGLICVDLDNVDDIPAMKHKLRLVPTVVLAFVSASGKGLAVVHRYELPCFMGMVGDPEWQAYASHHERVFDHLQSGMYSGHADPSCRDISRLRFVSYDPDLYYNEHAVPLKITGRPLERSVVHAASEAPRLCEDRVEEIESALSELGASDYAFWLKMGMAIHSEQPGLQGFGIWKRWSVLQCGDDKWDDAEAMRKWRGMKA